MDVVSIMAQSWSNCTLLRAFLYPASLILLNCCSLSLTTWLGIRFSRASVRGIWHFSSKGFIIYPNCLCVEHCSLHYINCSMVANGLAEVYCSLLVVVHSLTEMQMLFLKLLAQIQDGSGLVHPYVYRCFLGLFWIVSTLGFSLDKRNSVWCILHSVLSLLKWCEIWIPYLVSFLSMPKSSSNCTFGYLGLAWNFTVGGL